MHEKIWCHYCRPLTSGPWHDVSRRYFSDLKALELISKHVFQSNMLIGNIPSPTTIELFLCFLDTVLEIPQDIFAPNMELSAHLPNGINDNGIPR
jgi:hypothetical protein